MTARIFKPAKNAMQSGRAKTREWQLDYEPEQPRAVEPLMGWTSSGDMKQQLTLHFDTKEDAIAYCERKGVAYQVIEPKEFEAAAGRLRRQFRLQARRALDALKTLPGRSTRGVAGYCAGSGAAGWMGIGSGASLATPSTGKVLMLRTSGIAENCRSCWCMPSTFRATHLSR